MKKIITSILLVAALACCQKSEDHSSEVGDSTEVTFVSGISTRASGTLWDESDQIGVYMYESDNIEVYDDNSSNVKYTISLGAGTTNATFSSEDPLLFVGETESDFIAYHPYTTQIIDDVVSISTADQSSEAKLKAQDFMVARVSSCSYSNGRPTLDFSRKMSKIVFSVILKDNAENTVVNEAYVMDVVTEGSFEIVNNGSTFDTLSIAIGDSKNKVDLFNNNGVVEMLMIPQTLLSSQVIFNINDKMDGGTISGTYEAGYQYNYNIVIGEDRIDISGVTISEWEGVDDEPTDLGEALETPISRVTVAELMSMTEESLPADSVWFIIGDDSQMSFSAANSLLENAGRIVSLIFKDQTSVGDNAFYNARSIASVSMPEVVTCGANAFSGCSSLTTVVMNAVTSFGDYAFSDCNSLREMSLATNADVVLSDIGSNSFPTSSSISLTIGATNASFVDDQTLMVGDDSYTFANINMN